MPASRLTWFWVFLIAAGAGCAPFKLTPQEIEGEAYWSMEGASPVRTHLAPITLDPPLERQWAFNAEAGFGPASPIVYGNSVIVGTRRGFLMGVYAPTGKRIGRKRFDHPIEGGAVLDGDRLYIPFAQGKETVIAYDVRKGKAAWEWEGNPIEASLLLSDTLLIAVDDSSTVYAIGAESGETVWQQRLDTLAAVVAAPIAMGDALYVTDEHGLMTRLQAGSGEVVWQVEVGSPVYNSPAAGSGTLFVPGTRGQLFAVDTDSGEAISLLSLENRTIRFSSPAYDASSGELFVAATDGILRSVDVIKGTVNWQFQADAAISAPPLITNRTIYVGSLSGHLFGVDRASGAQLWTMKLDGRIKSAMAVQDGHLVVLSEPQHVHLLKPSSSKESVTDALPLSN